MLVTPHTVYYDLHSPYPHTPDCGSVVSFSPHSPLLVRDKAEITAAQRAHFEKKGKLNSEDIKRGYRIASKDGKYVTKVNSSFNFR